MRILVACEESQVVCKAFRELGHNAYSCDIQECSGDHPEWHIQGDVMKHINDGWDMMIAHPPCTYLCNSGVRWLYNKDGSNNWDRWDKLDDAIHFFMILQGAPIPKICIENPIPHKYAKNKIGEYTQLIQPWMFGHKETKATCLWLKGLQLLKETDNVKKYMYQLSNKLKYRIHYMSPGKERSKLRSKTFEGIAKAMANQWGS